MAKFSEAVAQIEIESDKPGRMTVLGFDRQPLRATDGSTNYIDLYSFDSEIARKYQRAVTNRRLKMKGRGNLTANELDAEGLELLVALTAGWGSIDKDGNVMPDPDFSPSAARELYSNLNQAELRSQVDEFAGERANFLTALSKN